MKKLLHLLAYLIIAGNLVLIGLVGYWMLRPYNLPEILVPIEILNEDNEIAIGERIKMRIVVDKPTNVRAQPNVFITCNDGNLVTLTPNVNNLPVGQYEVVSDSYVLPLKVTPGTLCRFNFRNSYQVNPLREEIREWYSEEFLVNEPVSI